MAAIPSEAVQPGKPAKQEPVPAYSRRTHVIQRAADLNKARQSQEPVLRDIQEHIVPYRGRFQKQTQDQRGGRRGLKVINGTAGRSMKILSSGMMAGLTSPGRPWFRLSFPDPDLSEYTPVRAWLDDVARSMRAAFARSNLYNILPSVYGELGPFGTSAMLEVDDPETMLRFYPFTMGTYGIAQDDRLVVDAFSREFSWTILQIVGKFGTKNLSLTALNLWKQHKLQQELELIHIIYPNKGYVPGGFAERGFKFIEEYWEKGGDSQEPLFRSGHRERALFVPRWDVNGDDLWGTGIGHEVLGDVKQLQFLERRKEDVLEKQTAPPLEAGAELRGKRISLLAGDVTYSNPATTGGTSIRPIVQVHPSAYQYVAQDIGALEHKIKQAAHEDLFLMLANDTRSGITAREVEERHQEKMLILGPVLERLNEELFDPLISRTFGIMQRRSLASWRGTASGGDAVLPKPPRGVEAAELRVEYTSILAQAAKATHTRGIEAFGMFVGQLAQVFGPTVLDKVDVDQMVDEYADAQGVPARIVRSDDDVSQIRGNREADQQQQKMLAAAPALKDAATAAKQFSEIPPDSAIATGLAGAMTGQAVT